MSQKWLPSTRRRLALHMTPGQTTNCQSTCSHINYSPLFSVHTQLSNIHCHRLALFLLEELSGTDTNPAFLVNDWFYCPSAKGYSWWCGAIFCISLHAKQCSLFSTDALPFEFCTQKWLPVRTFLLCFNLLVSQRYCNNYRLVITTLP